MISSVLLKLGIILPLYVQAEVINLETGLPLNSPWIEFGDAYINDNSWTIISSVKSDFAKAIIFVGLADIDPEYVITTVAVSTAGVASFQVKFSQEDINSTICPNWPLQPALTDTRIQYVIVEEGAVTISSLIFMARSGPLARQYVDPVESVQRFYFAENCPDACQFPDLNSVGVFTQLQSFINKRITVTRVISTAKKFTKLLLQPHDSPDSANVVLAHNETVGVFAFQFSNPLYCTGGFTMVSKRLSTTSTPANFTYGVVFHDLPAVFGSIGALGIRDFVALYVFNQTTTGAHAMASEDQCSDDEVLHSNPESVHVLAVGEIYLDPAHQTDCAVLYQSALSKTPTDVPSSSPTTIPSGLPTAAPSAAPTGAPSSSPTACPSQCPTVTPTPLPSRLPTRLPTTIPTSAPTTYPTSDPTAAPTISPTSIPSATPTALPTGTPTVPPTASPTELPSRSNVVDYFVQFDSSSLQASSPFAGAMGLSPDLQFNYSVNIKYELAAATQRWQAFVAAYAKVPLPSEYYRVVVWSSWLRLGDSNPSAVTFDCADVTVADALIRALGNSATQVGSSAFAGSCQQQTVGTSGGLLCVGCASSAEVEACPLVEERKISVVASDSCFTEELPVMSKHAVAVGIWLREPVFASVPVVSSIYTTPYNTSIVVTAGIATSEVGGSLCCDAFKSSLHSVPTREQLSFGGFCVPIEKKTSQNLGNVTAAVTLVNLVAVTSYDIYCVTSDAASRRGTRDTMLHTKQVVQTACCREITLWARSPSIVDLQRYHDGEFKITLALLPEEALTVRPVFLDSAGHVTHEVTSVPSSRTFLSSAGQLGPSRSFIFRPQVQDRLYSVRMELTGADALKYRPPADISFKTIGPNSVLPPPLLTRARFSNGGGAAVACFDGSTDMAKGTLNHNLSASWWVCADLFLFAGNNHTSCSWTSDSCVSLTFCGNGLCVASDRSLFTFAEPKHSLILRGGLLRAACNPGSSSCGANELAPEQTVQFDEPLQPLTPSVLISASKPGGPCASDLVLDASSSTGSGGRPWKSTRWTVVLKDSSAAANISNIQQLLDGAVDASVPVVVPFSLLESEVYLFTASLSNFLSDIESFRSVEVDASQVRADVAVVFAGGSSRVVRAYDPFEATLLFSIPDCISTEGTAIDFTVYKDRAIQPQLVSISPNPAVFRLDPYSFDSGGVYTVLAVITLSDGTTGQAVLTVAVSHGFVHIALSGGRKITTAAGLPLVLDASESVVEDVRPSEVVTTSPDLYWSCVVTKSLVEGIEYGDDCSSLFLVNVSASISAREGMPVDTYGMVPNCEYSFTASALSDTGEYVGRSVVVSVTGHSKDLSPYVTVLSSFRKFNVDRSLKLASEAAPPFVSDGVHHTQLEWTATDGSGESVALGDIINTPTVKHINDTVTFPLSALPWSFAPGRTYVFRLTASVFNTNSDEVIFTAAEISLIGNSAPTSGTLVVSPAEGLAYFTIFSLRALYWVDDVEDYPLFYEFKYSKGEGSSALTIGVESRKLSTTSKLPQGLPSRNSEILCSVLVWDFYDASVTEETSVIVTNGDSAFSVVELSSLLDTAEFTVDMNLLVQTVNNAVASMAAADCLYAPDCLSLHRDECSAVPHTCGECKYGFIGVAGAANSRCVGESTSSGELMVHALAAVPDAHVSIAGAVDEPCATDDDCILSHCEAGTCAYPLKVCPSTTSSSECSGAGSCLFSFEGGSGACTVADVQCEASCVCDEGYFGAACSLSAAEFEDRSRARQRMCEALEHFGSVRDPSSRSASTIAASAVSVFDPHEVRTVEGISSCLAVLDRLVNISNAGYMRNEDLLSESQQTSPHIHMAALAASFSKSLVLLKEGDDDEASVLIASIEYTLGAAVSALTNSVSEDMVAGEKEFDVVSDGLRMSIQYESLDSLVGASLQPPASAAEQFYGISMPHIILPASGLTACAVFQDEGYARFSVSEWDSNPYSINNSSFNGTGAAVGSRVLRFASMTSAATTGDGGPSTATEIDVEPYKLVMHYSTAQNWSLVEPTCGSYKEGEVVECPCKLQMYSAYSATFECYNLLDLCPAAESAGRRKLRELLHWGDHRHPHYAYMAAQQRRRLDFDYAGEADDGSSDGSVLEYAAMFKSIDSEFTRTVGTDPTNFAGRGAAMPVLILLGVMMAAMLVGMIILYRWDQYDWYYIKYVIRCLPQQKYKGPSVGPVFELRDAFVQKRFVAAKRRSSLHNVVKMGERGQSVRRQMVDASAERRKREQLESYFSHLDNNYRQDESDHENGLATVEYDEVSQGDRSCPSSATTESSKSDRSVRSTEIILDGPPSGVDKIGIRIATFFDNALPPTSLLGEKSGLFRFIKAIFREHDWVRMFTYASIRLPRTIRLMVVCTNALILLFADTLFYGILFPDTGLCEEYSDTSADQCEAEPSNFQSGENLCVWDEATAGCTVRPPPTTIQFYAVVAVLVTSFSVLPEVLCAYILEEVCAKTPVFREGDEDGGSTRLPEVGQSATSQVFLPNEKLQKMLNLYAYFDFMTVAEEANVLVISVRKCLHTDLTAAPLPWRQARSSRMAANTDAVMRLLGVYPDGSPVPLTLRQKLYFGNSRNRMECKIRKVRAAAKEIVEDMSSFTGSMEDCKDTTLIQHFILEQLSPFRRYALRKEFFQFDYAMPEKINGFVWLAAWTFMVIVWLFLVYWNFRWAMVNNGATVKGWSAAIAFVILQDVLVNEVLQIFIVHVIVIEALRPQLRRIYATLNGIMQEKATSVDGEDMLNESLDRERVVQHLSAACRAARHPDVAHLPSAQLLMRVNDYDVSICRDEKNTRLGWFTLAILAVPTALALSHESVQESFLDVLLPTLWSCFCIANAYLWNVHPMAMISPYLLLACCILIRYIYIIPQRRRLAAQKTAAPSAGGVGRWSSNQTELERQRVEWQNMNRQLEFNVDEGAGRLEANTVATERVASKPATQNPMHSRETAPRVKLESAHSSVDIEELSEMTRDDMFSEISGWSAAPSHNASLTRHDHRMNIIDNYGEDSTVFSEISCARDNCSKCGKRGRSHHGEEEKNEEISYPPDRYKEEEVEEVSSESARSHPWIRRHLSDLYANLVQAEPELSCMPAEIASLHDRHKAEKFTHRDNTGGMVNRLMNKYIWRVNMPPVAVDPESHLTRAYEELQRGGDWKGDDET